MDSRINFDDYDVETGDEVEVIYQGQAGVEQTHCRRRDTKKWVDHSKKRNRRNMIKKSRKKNRRR